MKYSIAIIFFTLSLVMATSAIAQKGATDQFEVKVNGLGCPFCAYGLEKKFKEFKGIKAVKIEMETGIMTFKYPAEKGLTIPKIEKQVEKAGYTPVKVTIRRATGKTETSAASNEITTKKGQIKETAFFVAGNCGMCKARIEKAAKSMKGVSKAVWDKKTKQLSIEYDTKTTSSSKVAKVVAEAGHDTKTAKANTKTYDNLPGCCHYERVK